MWGKQKGLQPGATDTLIGEGTLFEGNIRSKASIRIEGQVKGDIDCTGDITIGEQGTVTSILNARNIIIAGTVQGNVSAGERITITSTGRLYGNLTAKALIVSEGAIFRGGSSMAAVTPAPIPLKEKTAD